MRHATNIRLRGSVFARLSRTGGALLVFLAACWASAAAAANVDSPSPAAPGVSATTGAPDASGTPLTRPGEAALDVFPAEIATATGGRAPEVQVRLRTGSNSLTNITLGSFSNDGVSITKIAPPPWADHLSPGADYVWNMQLAADNVRTVAAKLYLRVDFDSTGAPPANPVHRTLYAQVTLAAPPVFQPIVMAETNIAADPATLVEQRGGDAYLTIKNQYSLPLTVTGISPLGPEYTQIALSKIDATTIDLKAKPTASPPPPAFPLRIAAGETVVLTYHVTVLPKVVPGTYPVLLVIKMTADDGRQAILAPESSISVGVLGELEFFKLLGVPSFLFLPGFLIIVVFQTLWPIGKTDEQGPPISLAANSAEFWAVAVLLSITVGFIYPWLPFGRDYFISYGLIDLFYIYSFSIAIAIIAFGIWPGAKRWRNWRHMPRPSDTPISLLKKMAWHKARIDLRQARRAPAASPEAFVLEPWIDQTTIWLVPRIMVDDVQDPAQHPVPVAAANQLQQIVAGTTVDSVTASRCLSQGIAAGYWRMYWRQGGIITEPTPIRPAEDQWTLIDQRAPLVGEPH